MRQIRMILKKIIRNTFIILFGMLWSCETSIQYPETKKITHSDFYHGIEVSDPYRWLEDDMSNETGEWVKSQNKVCLLYTSPSPRDKRQSRMPSSA